MNQVTDTTSSTPDVDPAAAIIGAVGQDILTSLRSTGTLVTFTARKWSGEVNDKGIADGIKADAGATGDVAKVIKNVMAGSDKELKAVNKILQAARTDFYNITMPWYSGKHDAAGRKRGARFLPNRLFDQFTKTMGRHLGDFRPALDGLIVAYPQRVQEAIANLGKIADATDYPDAAFIRSCFAMSTTFNPIPKGGDFGGLPEETLHSLGKAFDKRVEQSISNATVEAMSRTAEVVGRMAERLGDEPDPEGGMRAKRFHNTLVTNIEDMVDMLPAFNISNSIVVADIIEDLKTLVTHDAKELRENNSARTDTAAKARAVADKMTRLGL